MVWGKTNEVKGAHQVLIDELRLRWTSHEQRVFLDNHYLERMQRAGRISGQAHAATMAGRFVVGGASLAPILTAAGAVANSGFQFWLKIVGIGIGALVAVVTATMVAVRASPTWQTYYDLRVALEQIGWQAQSDPTYAWSTFVTAVNQAITDHSTRYAARVVDPSATQPGM
jgi:hypothetical protein